MASDFLIKLYDDAAAFDVLREDWRRLYAESDAAPFSSWEWAATWFQFFGTNRTPFILAAYSDEKLAAVLPLYFEKKKILMMPLKKLALIGSEIGGAAYLDVVASSAVKAAATRAFLQFLDERSGIDILELESVNADSILLQEIQQKNERSKFSLRVAPQNICQFAEVGVERERFLARIFNDTAKKKLKRLKKLGEFEFRRTTDAAETGAAFERFTALHDGNWTQKGGSDVTGHERLLDFHFAVAAANGERGAIFFDELWIENRCIAALYGFHKSDTYFYYSSGYDEQLAKLSPMVTLYNLSIENGLANGFTTFDFLCGDQSYKSHWTTDRNELVTVSLRRSTVPALAYEIIDRLSKNVRDFLNYALPPGFLEKIKSVRRKWKRKSRLAAPSHGEIVQETI